MAWARLRISPVRLYLLLGLAVLASGGCSDDDVGYPCQATSPPEKDRGAAGGLVITTPAHDCVERVCVQAAGTGQGHGLCSRSCAAADDCPGPSEACPEGFSCAYAAEVGPLWCCKLCLCSRYTSAAFVAQACAARPLNPSCPR